MHTETVSAERNFLEEVLLQTPGDARLELCLQCGTCSGSCPSGADMDHTPRGLFALIAAGEQDVVLRSNTPWTCVSCYYCTVRCPQEIHITDLMYTLKRLAIRAGHFQDGEMFAAASFSNSFIDQVERYGRSFELGLATRYHLRHHPLNAVKMATGMGLEMMRKGRMDITPRRIRNIGQLQAILNKAKDLSARGYESLSDATVTTVVL